MGSGLSHTAYEILLNRIITNEYSPGCRLNELSLQSELNISRTPIHTAMIMLQQENLVKILPKKGVLVADITADSIRDIYDVRTLMELHALKKFGMCFQKDKVLEYLHIFSRAYTQDQYELVFRYDAQLHMDIVALTGNRIMCSYYSFLKNQFIRLSNLSGRSNMERVSQSNREHVNLLTAILQDDMEAAEAALSLHLQNARESVYRAIILHDDTAHSD